MKVIDFLNKLHATPYNEGKVNTACDEFIFDKEFQNCDEYYDAAKNFFDEIWSDKDGTRFTSILSKLEACIQHCVSKEKDVDVLQNGPYADALNKAKQIFEELRKIYDNVAQGHQKEKNKKHINQESIESAIAQHEESLKEIKDKIKELNGTVHEANKFIDDKIFTLLLNTVAILGIFVAIAFAGFGVVSIFSSIDLKVSLISTNAFFKNIFFLLLVALLSYNLLLLLVYFIYKLSRPIFPFAHSLKDDAVDEQSKEQIGFKSAINLGPFLIIDIAIAVLVVVFFFLSIAPEIICFVKEIFAKQK